MFDFLNKPLGWIIKFCYDLVDNYALALLLFALVMQIILLPLGIKQQKNSVKQAKMRPKEIAIRNKYKGRNDKETQQKMQNEIMEMYQKENFNPMGGCLPLLIQLPILFALFNVVTQPLTYICGFDKQEIYDFAVEITEQRTGIDITTEDAIKNLTDDQKKTLDDFAAEKKLGVWDTKNDALVEIGDFRLSSIEINYISEMKDIMKDGNTPFVFTEDGETKTVTSEHLPNFSLAGDFMDLSLTPAFTDLGKNKNAWLLLIPLFTAVFTYGSQFITKKFTYQSTIQEQQDNGSLKVMQLTMPLLSVFISFQIAAAIGLYWIFRNILSTIQTVVLYKLIPVPKFTEADYKAAERELKGKGPKASTETKERDPNKPKVRSLHRIDEDDEYIPPVKKPIENESNEKKIELREDADVENAPKLKDESDRKVNKSEEKSE